LEEAVQAVKEEVGVRMLEAAVGLRGEGKAEVGEHEGCGGQWVFREYRERQVMITAGMIRVRRAYYTCDRCGAGFPLLDEQLEVLEGWSERAVEGVWWTVQVVSSYREAEEALERWGDDGIQEHDSPDGGEVRERVGGAAA